MSLSDYRVASLKIATTSNNNSNKNDDNNKNKNNNNSEKTCFYCKRNGKSRKTILS